MKLKAAEEKRQTVAIDAEAREVATPNGVATTGDAVNEAIAGAATTSGGATANGDEATSGGADAPIDATLRRATKQDNATTTSVGRREGGG